jgi:hypothetical protein
MEPAQLRMRDVLRLATYVSGRVAGEAQPYGPRRGDGDEAIADLRRPPRR